MPTKEEKFNEKYDALAAYSEYALLTEDAPRMGDIFGDLDFSYKFSGRCNS